MLHNIKLSRNINLALARGPASDERGLSLNQNGPIHLSIPANVTPKRDLEDALEIERRSRRRALAERLAQARREELAAAESIENRVKVPR